MTEHWSVCFLTCVLVSLLPYMCHGSVCFLTCVLVSLLAYMCPGQSACYMCPGLYLLHVSSPLCMCSCRFLTTCLLVGWLTMFACVSVLTTRLLANCVLRCFNVLNVLVRPLVIRGKESGDSLPMAKVIHQ